MTDSANTPESPDARRPVLPPPLSFCAQYTPILHALDDYQRVNRSLGKQLAEMFSDYSRASTALASTVSEACRAHRGIASQMAGFMASANTAMEGVSAHVSQILAAATDLKPAVQSWTRFWDEYTRTCREAARFADLFSAHVFRAQRATILAQSRLLTLADVPVGKALSLRADRQLALQTKLTELTESYSSLVEAFAREPGRVAHLPPPATGDSAVEVYTAAELAASITLARAEQTDVMRGEDAEFRRGLARELDQTIEGVIATIHNDLPKMWQGARAAVCSNCPDGLRHFAVSLRELLGHLLRLLAPDTLVRAWTSDQAHFQNGKPTRRARLLYICRVINQDAFTKFVNKDIEALLEFMAIFQEGTHAITSSLTPRQLEAILIRAECAIRFLVLAARTASGD